MTRTHDQARRPRSAGGRWRRLGRGTTLAALASLLLTVGVPGVAWATFSSSPVPVDSGVAAAAIGAPGHLTDSSDTATTVTLTWTAPAALTGYTLTQSPGTLAGCSATPSAATTTCTATGLTASTQYTFKLESFYNDWVGGTDTFRVTTP